MGLRTKVMNRLGWVRKRNVSARIVHPLRAVKRTLQGKQVSTIFDVGAFDGGTAKGYRQGFPDATIFSFEPTPAAFEKLVTNTAEDSKIVAVNLALADAPGRTAFQVNQAGVTNSLLGNARASGDWVDSALMEQIETIEVQVDTLDAYCAREGIEQIDLLKIDAQGVDLKVLQGATQLLEGGKVTSIFIETCIVPLYEGQGELHEIYGLLHSKGYCLFDLLAPAHAPSGQLMWCDLLFVKGKGVS
jgi:FkbM family methyltransferase